MAISGLVVTLTDDAWANLALDHLAADSRISLGEQFGRRLAMVAETPSAAADRELWDELRELPGIVNIDVTFVHLDAIEPANSATSPAHGNKPNQTTPEESFNADH